MIPNGILLMNVKQKQITFANKELLTIMNGMETGEDLEEKVTEFIL